MREDAPSLQYEKQAFERNVAARIRRFRDLWHEWLRSSDPAKEQRYFIQEARCTIATMLEPAERLHLAYTDEKANELAQMWLQDMRRSESTRTLSCTR